MLRKRSLLGAVRLASPRNGQNRVAGSPFGNQAAFYRCAEVAGLPSVTTVRGSPVAARYCRTTSSNGIVSGPANSTVPFNGFARLPLARAAATSSENHRLN